MKKCDYCQEKAEKTESYKDDEGRVILIYCHDCIRYVWAMVGMPNQPKLD